MLDTLILCAVAGAGVWAWERWDLRRGVDEELAARQGAYGWRLIQLIGAALVVLVVALVLEGVGVAAGGAAALVAAVLLVLSIYVAPLFAPRRRRR